MIEDIQQALIAFPEKDLEAFRKHTSYDPKDANPDVGFFEVDHDRYQWIVDIHA